MSDRALQAQDSAVEDDSSDSSAAEKRTKATPELRSVANPITSSQIEVVSTRAVSIFSVLFGLQTLPALISQLGLMDNSWGLTGVISVYGSLALAGLASIFRQWTAPLFGLVSAVYLAVVISWILFSTHPLVGDDAPWVYYLCNVATACAVVAVRKNWWLPAIYIVVVSILIGFLRASPAGGGLGWRFAIFDVFYGLLLGFGILVIVVSLRHAAAQVDIAQADALVSYTGAVRENATESERVAIDALVHDNVLISLLSAARARTPETKVLSAQMARNAMRHLVEAQSRFPGADHPIDLRMFANKVRLAVADQQAPFDMHARGIDTSMIPQNAADALLSAATQAMVNSVNHAGKGGGAITRTVVVQGEPGGVSVTVTDNGTGFDMDLIPLERLGVRTSILERVSNVGGLATVKSAPGEGTVISVIWPAPETTDLDTSMAAAPARELSREW
ncbi:sensor histidine kinase [Naasia lichenicola]|uniref:ATP-binding protein n=1 Tax=Naasia lichenicola TaxID=2565933 RepID=A0A4S4FLS2_9MICO|nr:ATP-binding protein [Naasia lichenicola]THG30852.1 ATP-binding protein [Naasia lichenicola]